jgi:dihydroorotate dehydrogenase electron transfer subunit
VSPFWLLARELRSHGVDATIVLGARTGERVVGARDLAVHGFEVLTCTDDGSAGFRGTVAQRIATLPQVGTIYACGPPAMLRAICQHATAHRVACQVSMEETFGCSLGTCWGCVVPVRRGCAQGTGYPRAPGEKRDFDLARVCADGSVFDAVDLVWAQ